MSEKTTSVWRVGDLLKWTEGYFRRLGLSSPRLDAEILLARALEARRLDLYTGYDKLVEPEERARFRALVERRAQREPVAYITGEREFFSLAFKVGPGVLIPRPETEHLVETALEALDRRDAARSPPRLLDLGTGCGNLAVTLAVKRADLTVDAVDISAGALETATANAARHGVVDRIRFVRGDLFEALEEGGGGYCAIVSNPPYVSGRDMETLMEDVRRFEPREALYDSRSPDADGLGFYRAIAPCAAGHLEPGGALIVEVGAGQALAVTRLFAEAGLRGVTTSRDLGGIERVVIAYKPDS